MYKEKKRMGGGFEAFYHVSGWDFLLFFAEPHGTAKPAVPQVLETVTT